jgi:hypothetical protein
MLSQITWSKKLPPPRANTLVNSKWNTAHLRTQPKRSLTSGKLPINPLHKTQIENQSEKRDRMGNLFLYLEPFLPLFNLHFCFCNFLSLILPLPKPSQVFSVQLKVFLYQIKNGQSIISTSTSRHFAWEFPISNPKHICVHCLSHWKFPWEGKQKEITMFQENKVQSHCCNFEVAMNTRKNSIWSQQKQKFKVQIIDCSLVLLPNKLLKGISAHSTSISHCI